MYFHPMHWSRWSYFLSILSAVVMARSWPSGGYPILAFVGFVPLLLAEYNIRNGSRQKTLKCFATAFLMFLIWHILSVWWLWKSTAFGAIIAIGLYSTLYSLVFLCYHRVSKRFSQVISLIFFVAVFVAFEKFSINWELSFPWFNPGNVFSETPLWVQWYEYTGVFGGTVWVLLVNVMIFSAIVAYRENKMYELLKKRLIRSLLVIVIPIVLSMIIYINYKEDNNPVDITVLQPNVDPYIEKYVISNFDVLASLEQIAVTHTDSLTDIIIAPETVFPNYINIWNLNTSYEIKSLRDFMKRYDNATFLTGIQLVKYLSMPQNEDSFLTDNFQWLNVYNSSMVLPKDGFLDFYYKSKPVAGVEYFPYKKYIFPILGDLMINLGGIVGGITRQDHREVFDIDSAKVAPIICYESVYGEYVADYVKLGADLLTVMTNDSWWGNTQGHKQLLSYTRLRAIETRRSIARSANTGVSCFIDQRGDIISSLPYDMKGALRATLNKNDSVTFYVKYGDILAVIGIVIAVFIFGLSFVKQALCSR